ncbi:MAG TPA: hypothetical protein VJ225_00630 [Nitrososphaeraceae archaeon]|nr:hypothetical protein [Nitrososphaeraceae archaeon]
MTSLLTFFETGSECGKDTSLRRVAWVRWYSSTSFPYLIRE